MDARRDAVELSALHKDLRRYRCCLLKDLDGGKYLTAQGDFAALLRVCRSKQVRAEADLYACRGHMIHSGAAKLFARRLQACIDAVDDMRENIQVSQAQWAFPTSPR